MEIKTGITAKDLTTGIKGILVAKQTLIGGTVQFNLQFDSSKKSTKACKYPAVFSIDAIQLAYVDPGISDCAVEPVPATLQLGEPVTDIISGFKGVLTCETVFLNGCRYYTVEAKGEGKLEDRSRFLNEQRLQSDGPTIIVKPKPRGHGGPVTRAFGVGSVGVR
jgi:hypothetical protein